MIDQEYVHNESGYSSRFALTAAAIGICAALVIGAATVLVQAAADSGGSSAMTHSSMVYASAADYFPSHYVNQAREIEPMPATF